MVGKPEGNVSLQCLDIDGRVILKWILIEVSELDSSSPKYEHVVGSCDHSNKSWHPIKFWGFLE
jgi:hypothetical protein